MAKKSVKKRVVRRAKKSVRRVPRKIARMKVRTSARVIPQGRTVKVAFWNLVVFAVLCGLSIFLFSVSTQDFFLNLFWLLGLVTGFVALAFLIALLVLLVLRSLKKK